ncbi:hypothetical protein HZS_2849, partial [Henneguya salminicola]
MSRKDKELKIYTHCVLSQPIDDLEEKICLQNTIKLICVILIQKVENVVIKKHLSSEKSIINVLMKFAVKDACSKKKVYVDVQKQIATCPITVMEAIISKAFFSEDCINQLKIKLSNSCGNGKNNSRDYRNFCQFGTSVCDHFVCQIPYFFVSKDTITFGNSKTHCLIPKPDLRKGLLAHAPRFTPCFQYRNGSKKFCYADKCTNSDVLSNCHSGNCTEIEVKVKGSKKRRISPS